MKLLNLLAPGEKAYIVDMQNTKLCEKLFEHGIMPGDEVEMHENEEGHRSLVIIINRKKFQLFKKAAETILTNPVSLEVSLN